MLPSDHKCFCLTPSQYETIKKAFSEVDSQGGPDKFYQPRKVLPVPFLEKECIDPEFDSEGVKAYGIFMSNVDFDGKCVAIHRKDDMYVCFSKQCLSAFCGYGGVSFTVKPPGDPSKVAREEYNLKTVEHAFQMFKASTVKTSQGDNVLSNVLLAKTPGKAKMATVKNKLDVTGDWNSISKDVMELLMLCNLGNPGFYALMVEIARYAESSGYEGHQVHFVETTSDGVWGWGLLDSEFVSYPEIVTEFVDPFITDGPPKYPGTNFLGCALKVAFDRAYEHSEGRKLLVIPEIVFRVEGDSEVEKVDEESGEKSDEDNSKRQCLSRIGSA